MNIIDDVKPLSFFKQKTGEVVKHIKNTKKPTFITINGNVELVIQDAESYQNMIDYVNSINDVNKIMKAVNEVEKGEGVTFEESFSKLRKKYSI